MNIQIPQWIQWLLAICSLLTTVGFLYEKVPKIWAYLKRPSPKDAGRTRTEYLVGSLLALLCAVIWAASYASLSVVSKSVGTLTVNIYLMGFAAISLYLSSVLVKMFEHAKTSDVIAPWQTGRAQVLVIANLGNFVLSVLALTFISASEAMALNNLSPLVLAFLLWFRGKLSPSFGTFLALALVVIAAFVVNLDSGFILRSGDRAVGSLIAVLAGASFAVWTFTLDELKPRMGSVAARLRTLSLVFATSFTLLVTVGYLRGGSPPLSTRDFGILSINGLRVAVVHLLYQVAIEKAGPLLASIILVLMVPLTFPFDEFWNGALISPQLVIGALLIVFAAVGLLGDELRKAV